MGKEKGFETLAIHAGQSPDPTTGALMTPIYQTSTFRQQGIGRHKGYEYSRTSNPTRKALEDCLAALEGGAHGLAFASGMAAIDAVLHLLMPGDRVVAINDLYGGTFRIFERVFANLGLDFRYAPASAPEDVAASVDQKTRLIWLETPTNPLLNLCDIAAISSAVHELNPAILTVVDNTFATPYTQQPLRLGADIVIHSTTKYLGGHSDVVGGAMVIDKPEVAERLQFLQNAVGAIPGPFDCFLVLRGIKTLAVRMERHAANAQRIASFLEGRPEVAWVRYPGLPSHPQYDLAKRQMRDGGGMVSFALRDGAEAAVRLVEATRLFALAESLGSVESLIEVPAAMTHASTSDSPFALDPALVRLSVGLETAEDLIEDLEQAFEIAA